MTTFEVGILGFTIWEGKPESLAPNDEAAMEFGLRVGSLGSIRTTTLKAFTEEEIAKVVNKLG